MDHRLVLEVVEKEREVTAWELTRTRKTTHERYITLDADEARRRVDTESLELRLYCRRGEGEEAVLGESQVVLNPGDDIAHRVRLAVEMARGVANPPFPLVRPGLSYPEAATFDITVAEHPLQAIESAVRDIRENCGRLEVSSIEVTAGEQEVFFLNSLGLELRSRKTEMFADFVLLTGGDPDKETEIHGFKKSRRLRDLNMGEMVREYGSWVKESPDARQPPTGTFDVVFTHDTLDTFFLFHKAQASGPAAHQGWSHLREGQAVADEVRGDRLTLISDPLVPGGLESGAFDLNGLPLTRREVIVDGVFRTRMADSRYAAYLGMEPVGAFTNLVVPPGETPLEELFSPGPVLQVMQFSVFAPNAVTGAFSGEIRFGRLVENGIARPVKGGSVSGMMDQAMRDITFSRETVQRGAYLGPRAIKVRGLTVAGER